MQIYASGVGKVVFSCTGGGGHLSGWLLGTAGASNLVLHIEVPYARPSLRALIGDDFANEKYVSEAIAVAMAKASYEKAVKILLDEKPDDIQHIGITVLIDGEGGDGAGLQHA